MRKLFTILISSVILLSGMHFTIATHFCGNQIAATKVSVTGKKASCGMETAEKSFPFSGTTLNSHCCDDVVITYKVDNDYSPAEFHYHVTPQNIILPFIITENFNFQYPVIDAGNDNNISPPHYFAANAVSMADICVFRV